MRLARLVILGFAAVFAFGAMSTGTALAGLLAHWLVNGKPITGTEHIGFHYTSGVSRLWNTPAKQVVICNKDTGEGTFLPGNLDHVSKGEFTECQDFEAKLNAGGTAWEPGALICPVANVVLKPSTSFLGFTLATPLMLANRFAPTTGKEFAQIKFAETCPGELKNAVLPVLGEATGVFLLSQENKEQEHGEQVFEVHNVAAGVTQEPEQWLLEADEPSSALKTTLTLGGTLAAFESVELVLLNAGGTFGALK
jgi:hypothetical protein